MATTSKKTLTLENEPVIKTTSVVDETVATVEETTPVVEEITTPEPEPVTSTFSPETFSTELVMNTVHKATARETAPVRRRRLRHLGYI